MTLSEAKITSASIPSYDFDKLTLVHPPLARWLEGINFNFSEPEAIYDLNFALLKDRYNLREWHIPEGYLVPPVPSRTTYIEKVAERIRDNGRILDIGCGANLIYPIIACYEYGFHCVGTELNETSYNAAVHTVQANALLKARCEIRRQIDRNDILHNAIKKGEYFDAVICNPPFFSSRDDADRNTRSKNRALKNDRSTRRNFAGQDSELWCKGGEALFISKMAKQSQDYANQVGWFSSLVANKESLKKILKVLKKLAIAEHYIEEMKHGKKTSRVIFWRF